MYKIEKNITKEYIIQKSRFICLLINVNNIEEIQESLNNVKKEYKKASHYCYAYILSGLEKCSDDKEPQGTAGIPILNILKKKQLNNILCIVVRYFGGIKLGAGGLIRAYQNSVLHCFEDVNIIDEKKYIKYQIIFDYDKLKNIEYILKDQNTIEKNFDDKISFTVEIDNEDIINLLKEKAEIKRL